MFFVKACRMPTLVWGGWWVGVGNLILVLAIRYILHQYYDRLISYIYS